MGFIAPFQGMNSMQLVEIVRTSYGEYGINRSFDRFGFIITDRNRMNKELAWGISTIDRARDFVRYMVK
jgi:hypothetical protein